MSVARSQVVVCAGRHLVEHELLRGPAAEQHVDLAEQLVAGHQVAVVGGQLLGVAERRDAARDDRDLVHLVGARGECGDQRVAGLVRGDDLALLRVDQPVLLRQAGDHAVDRLVEVAHVDRGLAACAPPAARPRSPDWRGRRRRSRACAGRSPRGRRPAPASRPCMWTRRIASRPVAIGPVDQDLAVEAAGAQQGRVEHLGPVGRGEDDDALARCRSRPSRPAAGSACSRARRARRACRRRRAPCRARRARR